MDDYYLKWIRRNCSLKWTLSTNVQSLGAFLVIDPQAWVPVTPEKIRMSYCLCNKHRRCCLDLTQSLCRTLRSQKICSTSSDTNDLEKDREMIINPIKYLKRS